jgi:hypothetical protein
MNYAALIAIALFLTACGYKSQNTGPRFQALTPLDGAVAAGLEGQVQLFTSTDPNLETAGLEGIIVDGSHTNAAAIVQLKPLIRRFYEAGKTVLFVDLDDLDDAPGVLSVLGFATLDDTYGSYFRKTQRVGFTTLQEHRLGAKAFDKQDALGKAELVRSFVKKMLDDTSQSQQLSALATCPTDPTQCASVPVPPGEPSLIRAILASETILVAADQLPQTVSIDTGSDGGPLFSGLASYNLVTASVSHNIYLSLDFNQGGQCADSSKTPPYTIPLSCMRYGVAVYPYINTTPNRLANDYYKSSTLSQVRCPLGQCTYGTFYLVQPAQTQWTLSWKVGINGDPTLAAPLEPDDRTPTNTVGQKTVANTQSFSLGASGGASVDIGPEGVSLGPDIKVGATWSNSTTTVTEISDWEITDNFDPQSRLYQWEYASTNPQWATATYTPNTLMECATPTPSGSNTLSRGTLSMAPSFSYTFSGSALNQAVNTIDLWFTAEGTAGLPVFCAFQNGASKTSGGMYFNRPVALTEEGGTQLSLNIAQLFNP